MSVSWDVFNENVKEFPTVVPLPDDEFYPLDDAKSLRAAVKGFGTDEQVILNILCQRSSAQRQTIIECYHRTFFRYLIADLKSDLSGNFENVIVGLMMPTERYCAHQLHKAFRSKSHDVLVEILCSRSHEEVAKIATAYEDMYDSSLASDIKKETCGSYQRLLLLILQKLNDQSCGYGDFAYDPDIASQQARIIFKAVKGNFRTDENAFLDIFGYAAQRRHQTCLIFHEYQRISGKSIEETLKSQTSGVLLNSLLTIVKSVNNRALYFAERLHRAMKGLGTDDNSLIRIIVSRCEIDLLNIMFEYERIYGKTLFSAVKEETSGYYRRSLLTIIGMEQLVKSMPSPSSCCSLTSLSDRQIPWYQSQQSLGWHIRETIRKFQN
ncbi:annexin A4-like isoform X1 [Daphnia pulicaria]|uniref:annexin A4-like isoform X1 n=2 Tax=Daphnia pulicaria TaxID=35523 RepID=UPI001EEB97C4|nr:annexin A4-like isoform X1 [Daphnia pulicaria]